MVIFFDVKMGETQKWQAPPKPCPFLVLNFIIHFLSQENWSALHLASAQGQSGVVELLVKTGAQLDIQTKVNIHDSYYYINAVIFSKTTNSGVVSLYVP